MTDQDAERAAEQKAVLLKMQSEQFRRRAMRGALWMKPSDRQAQIEDLARVVWSEPETPDVLADEQARCHDGRTIRQALAWEIARASQVTGLPLPVEETSLAASLLTSHDYTYGVDVEFLPITVLSFGRIWAHVKSLGFPMHDRLAASITRRTLTVLLNASRIALEAPVVVAGIDDVTPTPTVVLTEPEQDAGEPVAEEPVDATPEAGAPEEPLRKRHDRRVVGYVKVTSPLDFHGLPVLDAGVVLEAVEPNKTEADELRRMAEQQRPQVMVWWREKARMIPASHAERVGAEDWKEDRDDDE